MQPPVVDVDPRKILLPLSVLVGPSLFMISLGVSNDEGSAVGMDEISTDNRVFPIKLKQPKTS